MVEYIDEMGRTRTGTRKERLEAENFNQASGNGDSGEVDNTEREYDQVLWVFHPNKLTAAVQT